MITDIIKGVVYYFKGLPYLTKGRLSLYALAPGFIGALLGVAYIVFAFYYADDISAFLLNWYPWETGETTVEFIGTILTMLVLVVPYFLFLKYVILIIGGPFMSPFSERIEQAVTGEFPQAAFDPKEFVTNIIRGIRVNVRNIIKEIGITLLLLLLSLIPGFAVVTSPLLFLVGAYYAGFGNMDFTLERYFKYKGSIEFVKSNRGLALGNGIVFMFLFTIPVIGIFLALPLATAASTLHVLEKVRS